MTCHAILGLDHRRTGERAVEGQRAGAERAEREQPGRRGPLGRRCRVQQRVVEEPEARVQKG